MNDKGLAGGSRPSLGRSWHANELMPDVTRRLSRSATIALLLSPAGLLIIAITRLLIISDYSSTTALAIASSGGYVNTLFGTVIPLVPILLPYFALGLLFFNRVILGILAFLAAAFVSPTTLSKSSALQYFRVAWHNIIDGHLHIILIAFAVPVTILLLVELVGLGFTIFFKTLAAITCIALIPFASIFYPFPINNKFYAQLIRQPWLPSETITLSSGFAFTGYVLSEDQDWTVILGNSSRTIYYYHTSEITKRQVCQLEQTVAMAPLISLIPPDMKPLSRTPSCEISSVNPTSLIQSSSSVLPASGQHISSLTVSPDQRVTWPIQHGRSTKVDQLWE